MMMLVRLWHHYIGFLIAPSVLFFALTGAVQIFSLHEAHGDYRPPPLIAALSAIHKDQVFKAGDDDHAAGGAAAHHHHHDDDDDAGPPPPAAGASSNATAPAAVAALDHDHHAHAPRLGTALLKWFFLAVAAGLAVSTCLGLWIGLTNMKRRGIALALLAAGAVIPVVLLMI
jgi:hypothetical protein